MKKTQTANLSSVAKSLKICLLASVGVMGISASSAMAQATAQLQRVQEPVNLPANCPEVELRVIETPNRIGPVDKPVIDESALRYYARIRDFDKLEAEIARLRRIDPDWVPPTSTELFAASPEVADEQEFWDLFRAGKYAEVRQAIAQRQQTNPSYRPSADLLEQLRIAELRQTYLAASEERRFAEVINIGETQSSAPIFGCENIDNIWRLAAAYGETKQMDKALTTYRYIIQTCPVNKERSDTILIASKYLSSSQLKQLIAEERARRAGDAGLLAELDGIEKQLFSGSLAGQISGSEPREFTDADLRAFAEQTQANKDAEAAKLLGWYYYRVKSYKTAETWFRRSISWNKTGEAVQGVMLSLQGRGLPITAERFAGSSVRSSERVRTAYVTVSETLLGEKIDPAKVPADTVDRIENYTQRYKSSRLATALGWWYYRQQNTAMAEKWFRQALSWNKKAKRAAEGLVVLLSSTNRRDEAGLVAAEYGISAPRVVTITGAGAGGGSSVAGEMAEALRFGDFDICLEKARDSRGSAAYDGGVSSLLGWCLLELNRPTEAVLSFSEALENGSLQGADRKDAVFGLAMATMRRGMPNAAMRLIEGTDMDIRRVIDLRAEALAQRAFMASENEEYWEALRILDVRAEISPERRDLILLRAWSLFNVGNVKSANEIFVELDDAYSTAETREGIRVTRRQIYSGN